MPRNLRDAPRQSAILFFVPPFARSPAIGYTGSMRDSVDLAVIGAGAAGLVAAITAARRGASVVLLERLPRIGKKLLATGGGRCNLLNDNLSASAFTSTDPGLVSSVLDRFGAAEIRAFFEGLGLRLLSDETGRVYPVTNQAATVLKVLELETGRSGISIETGFEARALGDRAGRLTVRAADGREVGARAVLLAGGGRSYPALGSDGSGHKLAAAIGHRIVTPVPSAVPTARQGPAVPSPPGPEAEGPHREPDRRPAGPDGGRGAALHAIRPVGDGRRSTSARACPIAMNREGRQDVSVVVDFAPFMSEAEMAAEFRRRGSPPAGRRRTSAQESCPRSSP